METGQPPKGSPFAAQDPDPPRTGSEDRLDAPVPVQIGGKGRSRYLVAGMKGPSLRDREAALRLDRRPERFLRPRDCAPPDEAAEAWRSPSPWTVAAGRSLFLLDHRVVAGRADGIPEEGVGKGNGHRGGWRAGGRLGARLDRRDEQESAHRDSDGRWDASAPLSGCPHRLSSGDIHVIRPQQRPAARGAERSEPLDAP